VEVENRLECLRVSYWSIQA